MDAASLKDHAIVALNGAARLGRVSEVLFDIEPLRVAALKAHGDDGDFIVPIDRISKFGPDAVMVETPDVREMTHAGTQGSRTLAELIRLQVVDEDGKHLGTVRTIEFDPTDGAVEQVVADIGGMLGMGATTTTIKARAIRGVGPDLLTITSSGQLDAGDKDAAREDNGPR